MTRTKARGQTKAVSCDDTAKTVAATDPHPNVTRKLRRKKSGRRARMNVVKFQRSVDPINTRAGSWRSMRQAIDDVWTDDGERPTGVSSKAVTTFNSVVEDIFVGMINDALMNMVNRGARRLTQRDLELAVYYKSNHTHCNLMGTYRHIMSDVGQPIVLQYL